MSEQELFFKRANKMLDNRIETANIVSFGLIMIVSLLILWLVYIYAFIELTSLLFKTFPNLEKKLDKKNNIYYVMMTIGSILSVVYSVFMFKFWFA